MTRKSMSFNHVGTGISKTAFRTRAAAGFTFAIGLLCAIEARAANVLTNPGLIKEKNKNGKKVEVACKKSWAWCDVRQIQCLKREA